MFRTAVITHALAVCTHAAPLLLLDETAARTIAAQNGLAVMGSVGILLQAKANGVIPEVMPMIEEMRDRARFWLSGALIQQIRQTANE
jgi:uncharacterized protein